MNGKTLMDTNNPKVIAFYLPQFHRFKENDNWWGEGFTEWTNTRKARPLYEGHYQPHIPLNENYYNLLNKDTWLWQIELAKKYGVYGFCFYHYWFNGKLLMEKPLEQFLDDKSLNIHFCLSWANESWTRKWNGAKGNTDILIEQKYGGETEWKKHFLYLLEFFKDERYIRIAEKPLIIVYRPELVPQFSEMIKCWRKMAKEAGFKDLFIMAQGTDYCAANRFKRIDDNLNGNIMYEPGFTIRSTKYYPIHGAIKEFVNLFPLNVICYCNGAKRILRLFFKKKWPKRMGGLLLNRIKYDLIWEKILNRKVSPSYYPGAFVNWDNTARTKYEARIIYGSTPQKFEKNMTCLIDKVKNEYKKEYIFLNAWNEWAEGCYIEPDEKNKYGYLEALKKAFGKSGA